MRDHYIAKGQRPVPVIIPAYEPDDRLLALLRGLVPQAPGPVILVDDGSGPGWGRIFQKAQELIRPGGGCLLTHPKNCGKGRALKTAFAYVEQSLPDSIGVVTADSDGQHTVDCIRRTAAALIEHPDSLILGVRTFDGEDVPWKSAAGNRLTTAVLKFVSGTELRDTQTGLRGIPFSFLRELQDVKGERFEFEMRMLLKAIDCRPIRQIPIQTVYDSKGHHQTHFRPFLDSIRIYRILGERFFKFIASSLSSALLDLVLFSLFHRLWEPVLSVQAVMAATIAARILSASYNYIVNYRFVFHSGEKASAAGWKYFLLAAVQMFLSGMLATGLAKAVPRLPAAGIKAAVDTTLFFISYIIQRRLIFRPAH